MSLKQAIFQSLLSESFEYFKIYLELTFKPQSLWHKSEIPLGLTRPEKHMMELS